MNETNEMLPPCLEPLSDQELHAHELRLQTDLARLREQVQALQEQCGARVQDLQTVQNESARRHLQRTAGATDWPYLLHEDGAGSQTRYNAAKAAVGGLAKLAHHEGLACNGYLPGTNQRGLRVSLLKNRPELTTLVAQALEALLPHVLPLPPEHGRGGFKYVSIFENSLSEHGKYFLAIEETQSLYELRISRYGRESVVHSATSLLALLQYVEQNHYYGD